ncbi:Mov34/MPN/PAD-1 family protein [Natrinema sp. 1APR25-10V2]|uniref:Mov34/MPN/PAD-1 family protein n=1 Tax=Natrinema sp. 1APR25-10V2 TaxID=2951081 RepID=UPI0028744552|nr:Mov34/MPN/PAD-1 family protein [Natrinema sp. 1APR25-10V2]MDS0476810.1 Mov34/MPN/PAD-1 family protein [Natrinema sp. 1APR25-10V2]
MIRRLWRHAETEPAQPAAGDTADQAARDTDGQRYARRLIAAELETAEDAFTTRWENEADLPGSIDALKRWHAWRTALACLEQAETPGVTFHVDGVVLADCYTAVCTAPDTETLTYLTGLTIEPTVRTLNRCLRVDHIEQSRGGAAADPDDSFAVLQELDATGRRLMAYCHNHPGRGAAATAPSSTDRRCQHRLEAAGYDVIGIIMTRDGYVRCFSNDLDFTVNLHGNHVQEIRPHLFRLDEPVRTGSLGHAA